MADKKSTMEILIRSLEQLKYAKAPADKELRNLILGYKGPEERYVCTVLKDLYAKSFHKIPQAKDIDEAQRLIEWTVFTLS